MISNMPLVEAPALKEPGHISDIKLVYFDVADVLLDIGGGLSSLANLLGADVAAVATTWREISDSISRGQTRPQRLWDKLKETFQYQGEDINIVDFWVSRFVAFPEAHNLVRKLSLNYAVGLLTNIYPEVLDLAIDRGFIPNVPYVSVIQSFEYGFMKPEPGIYLAAQDVSQVSPGRILLVDDSPENVYAATALGWRGFIFETDQRTRSIKEISDLLGV